MKGNLSHKNGILFSIREFLAFLRMETCLYITGMGIAGYLLFNPIGFKLLFLSLAVFFMTAAAYSYNFMKDIKEDSINNKGRLNLFVTNGKGGTVVAVLLCLGASFSLFLPLLTLLFFLISVPLIIIYSRYRLKEIFIVKNVYTGAGMGLVLIIGASVSGTLTGAVLYAFLPTFFFGTMSNILGDIKGYKGDFAAGVKTLPVKIGLDPSKKLFHTMMLGFSAFILLFRHYLFYPIVPFTVLISFFLAIGKHKIARYILLCTFLSFSAFLVVMKI